MALTISTLLIFSLSCHHDWQGQQKLIILGIDGMDPDLLTLYMRQGFMPNFAALAKHGSFTKLTTSIPPQSPVAWSNLITGMNAGGHGIFDFIHRNPNNMDLYFSASSVKPPGRLLHLGSWVLPLGSAKAEQLRRGEAFWQILDRYGVPNTVFRIPANFPPVTAKGFTFAGMGTPDLRGTYGTFSYYTDEATASVGPVEGGQIISVTVNNGQVKANLIGPDNTFRNASPPSLQPFTVSVDPRESVARVQVQGHDFVLREGEWSDWTRIEFQLILFFGDVRGMCRFFLKQAHPRFELYVSPMNIDPSDPALPLSTPSNYSAELAKQVGLFHTQGIAEDTKALSDGVLDDHEFLQQSKSVLREHRRIFDLELPKFRRGLFFFYFSSLDLNSHMLWRHIDPQSPQYENSTANEFGPELAGFYRQMDQVLGEIMRTADDHTTIMVVSDHGFAPYRRSFNLNTWLLQNGYLVLKQGVTPDDSQPLAAVDWSRTKAYAVGLNGLYANVRGREFAGILSSGSEENSLLGQIKQQLLTVRDPKDGVQVITRIDSASEAYQGPFSQQGPDLIIGYNQGYRAGWKSILGGLPPDILEDNTNPWSGDHCMDYSKVPGVLLTNRKVSLPYPALTDIAPTILEEFGVPKSAAMIGHSLFTQLSSPTAIAGAD